MRKAFLALLLTFAISACTSVAISTPPPSPQVFLLRVSSSLPPDFFNKLDSCAANNPEIALIVESSSSDSFGEPGNSVEILVGEPAGDITSYANILGWEELVVIVHPAVSPAGWTLSRIQETFRDPPTGRIVWTYPQGHELRRVFDQSVLDGQPTSPEAFLVPNPKAMLTSISSNPGSIGYIPRSWLTERVLRLPLDEIPQSKLRIPILAITPREPTGLLRNVLVCLQGPES